MARCDMRHHPKVSKRCEYCGRFFRSHPFVGDRQKACSRPYCKKKRKQSSQQQWVGKNTNYFHGRYPEVKRWREEHPGYQKLWRKRRREIQDSGVEKTPMKSLRLVVPESLFNHEIQDLALLVRRSGCGCWMAGMPVRDTRQDGIDSGRSVTSRPS